MKNIAVNPNALYELYKITDENNAPDLSTVGMAMFLKEHHEISKEESEDMRQFTGAHGEALAKAYPDEKKFCMAYAYGLAADMAFAIQKEEEEKDAPQDGADIPEEDEKGSES